MHFYYKHLVLHFERIQASIMKYKTIPKQKDPPFQFFLEVFLMSPKGLPSIFLIFCSADFGRSVLFFLRQTTELTLYIPLFSTDFIRFKGNPVVAGSSHCFSQKLFCAFVKPDETKGSPFRFFLDFVRLFKIIVFILKTRFYQWPSTLYPQLLTLCPK